MYKVFINDKVILFTNKKEITNSAINCLYLNFYDEFLMELLLQFLEKDPIIELIIICVEEVENAFNQFSKSFKLLTAAGGVVSNKNKQTLFIKRLNKWDLPKGKKEEGETIRETAIREVEEECGISGLKIIEELPSTFHIYELNNKKILKQTFWFKMKTTYDGELIPQIEENITEVVWLDNEEIKNKVIPNTYASIKELLSSQ